jgi:hypothetical protein
MGTRERARAIEIHQSSVLFSTPLPPFGKGGKGPISEPYFFFLNAFAAL